MAMMRPMLRSSALDCGDVQLNNFTASARTAGRGCPLAYSWIHTNERGTSSACARTALLICMYSGSD